MHHLYKAFFYSARGEDLNVLGRTTVREYLEAEAYCALQAGREVASV